MDIIRGGEGATILLARSGNDFLRKRCSAGKMAFGGPLSPRHQLSCPVPVPLRNLGALRPGSVCRNTALVRATGHPGGQRRRVAAADGTSALSPAACTTFSLRIGRLT